MFDEEDVPRKLAKFTMQASDEFVNLARFLRAHFFRTFPVAAFRCPDKNQYQRPSTFCSTCYY